MMPQLTEASQAQTVALADLKEELLLQDDADEPSLERQAESVDITQITVVVNDCTRDSSAKNVVSDSRSNSEFKSQNNIVESLTQAYLPNTKKSPAIEGKIAELIDNKLTGGCKKQNSTR